MVDKIIRFLDTYDLPWVILALLTWSLIYLICSREQFWRGLPVGIWTAIVGGVLEQFFITNKFWSERFIMIHLGELDLFLIVGPFFTLGIMLVRFLPRSRWGKALAVLAWAGLGIIIELLAIKLKFLNYHPVKWSFAHSYTNYVLGLMSTLGFYLIYANLNDEDGFNRSRY